MRSHFCRWPRMSPSWRLQRRGLLREQPSDTFKTLPRGSIVMVFRRHPSLSKKKGDVGDQLERVAQDAGAGLVIAGAYGHSRLREWVFGGVTRHFLQKSERCALLSR